MSETVNFIEAVNSGKRFRFKSDTGANANFFYLNDNEVLKHKDGKTVCPCKTLIMGKFVLEEKSITISESELIEAWGKSFNYGKIRCVTLNQLKKELGF